MIVVNPESPMHKALRYAAMAYRQRWVVLVCVVIGAAIGTAVAFALPEKFESHSQFIVEGQSIPDPFEDKGRSGNQNTIEERIQNLQHIVLSRTFLENVIDKSSLRYLADTPAERGRVIGHLKNSIEIVKKGPNVVSIGYRGDHPREAAEIANVILAQYEETINEMFGDKLRGLLYFLEEERENYRKRLSEAAEELAQFKRKHIEALPGSEGGHLSRLVSLETQLNEVDLSIQSKQREKEFLDEMLAKLEPMIRDQSTMDQSPELRTQARLVEALQQKLQATLLQRTEKSPEVMTLRERIEEATAKLEELKEKKDSAPQLTSETVVRNPLLTEQENSRAHVEMEIKGLEARKESLESEIAQVRDEVEVIPELEKQFAEKTLEYKMQESYYLALLREEHSQKLSKSMADHGQGAKFVLLEYPQENRDPVSPNIPLVILIATGAGLGLGGLIGFMREWLNQTVRSVDEVSAVLALPVIAAVPHLDYSGEEAAPIPERERRRFQGLSGGGAARPEN